MRWDVRITNHYYAAAAFLAVCLMAAPVAFHLEGAISLIIFWIALIGAVAFSLAGLIASLHGEESKPAKGHVRRMVSLYGMLACGLGFIGFMASYLFPGSTAEAPSVATPQPQSLQASIPQTKTDLDYTVGVRCSLVITPTAFRSDKKLSLLQIVDPSSYGNETNLAVGNTFTPAGAGQKDWPRDIWPQNPYQCEVINYGSTVILNARIRFDIKWLAVEKTETGIKSGKVLWNVQRYYDQFDLGAISPQNDFVWFVSRSPYFVQVSVPDTIDIKPIGSADFITVKLAKPASSWDLYIGMEPVYLPTSPSVATIPFSTPPAPPAGTSPQTSP